MSRALSCVVAVVFAMAPLTAQSESAPVQPSEAAPTGVPVLRDVPVLSGLFSGLDRRVFVLSPPFALDRASPSELPFALRQLKEVLEAGWPKVEVRVELDLEDAMVTSGDVRARRVESRLVLEGPTALVKQAAEIVEYWLTGQRETFSISIELRTIPKELLPEGATIWPLDSFPAGAFQRASSVTIAPKILAHDGDVGSISMLQPISYVRDFELRLEGATLIAEPIVDVIHEGLEFTAVATRGEKRFITAQVGFKSTTVVQPIPSEERKLVPPLQPITIQKPEIRERTQELRWTFGQDGGAMVAHVQGPRGEFPIGDGELIAILRVAPAPSEPAPRSIESVFESTMDGSPTRFAVVRTRQGVAAAASVPDQLSYRRTDGQTVVLMAVSPRAEFRVYRVVSGAPEVQDIVP